MLRQLTISNIILIDKVDIKFEPGLCVLTGETGAGKSILLDSLSLALGARAENFMIKHGEDQGSVIAEFDISQGNESGQYGNLYKILEDKAIESLDSSIILRRVINRDGKTRAFINDSPVSLGLLKILAENLIEIHGQNQQTGLVNTQTHCQILDEFGRLEKNLATVQSAYKEWRDTLTTIEDAKQRILKVKQEEDYLKFIVEELEVLDPKPGEEEELADKRRALMNQEKITDTLNRASAEIAGNNSKDVSGALSNAQRILYRSECADHFKEVIELLEKAADAVSEAAITMEKKVEEVSGEKENLEEVEERLFTLKEAARKYKCPVDDLPKFKEEIRQKLDLIEVGDKNIAELEQDLVKYKEEYIEAAKTLSKARNKAAKKLEIEVKKELAPLKLGNAKFKVELTQLPEEKFSSNGMEKAEFQVSTNPGSPFGSLSKIASGGELSRFMLALKVVLLHTRSLPTMIFDEVDTGIGGATADAVGKRLARLGKERQVLVVTHQPQVATYGSQHLQISKQVKSASRGGQSTVIKVTELKAEQRKEELARMLAGAEITEEARAAAEALQRSELDDTIAN